MAIVSSPKSELPTEVGPERAPPVTAFVVEVVAGPARGARLLLDSSAPGAVLVGTSAACQLVVSDRTVSRRHASLELAAGSVHVRDLGSTNGTFVGGTRILDGFAGPGSEVRLGPSTVLSVSASDAPVKLAPGGTGFGRVIGASAAMRRLYPILATLAVADTPILVEGERGTGKELLAEVLHESGPRASGPFVVVVASTLGASEAEGVLFGEPSGGAPGAVERAAGGTLFIADVDELPSGAQARLAKLLEGQAERRPEAPSFRLIASSQRNLDREVEAQRCREDFVQALTPGRVELPPLRDRRGDVALLAELFWRRLGPAGRPLPPDFVARHEGHAWSGNVRELEVAVAELADQDDAPPSAAVEERASAIPDELFRVFLDADLAFVTLRNVLVTEFERRYVARALEKHGGNVSRAAAASGLARRSFQMIRARHRR